MSESPVDNRFRPLCFTPAAALYPIPSLYRGYSIPWGSLDARPACTMIVVRFPLLLPQWKYAARVSLILTYRAASGNVVYGFTTTVTSHFVQAALSASLRGTVQYSTTTVQNGLDFPVHLVPPSCVVPFPIACTGSLYCTVLCAEL